VKLSDLDDLSGSISDRFGPHGMPVSIPWLLLLVVFATDRFTQLGFAHGLLYSPLILVTLFTGRSGTLVAVAICAAILTVAGLFISPPQPVGFVYVYVLLNRALAILAIGLSTALCLSILRNIARLETLNQKLSDTRQELQRNTELLHLAGEIGKVGGWTLDVRSNRVELSEQVARLHGVEPGVSYKPNKGIELYAPEDRPRVNRLLQECIEHGTPFDEEMRILHSDEVRWVRTIGRAVRDDSGQVILVQGAVQDISDWKAAQDSLVHSERSFRELADAMPMIVWTADPDGSADMSNRAMYDYAGYPPDQPLSAQDRRLLNHPDDQQRVLDAWAKSAATGEPMSVEVRLRRHDGVYRWHIIRAHLVRDEDGQPLKWYGTTIDVDDERCRAKEVERLAQRLNITMESITDGFLTVDCDWRFTFLNDQAERIIQQRREDILGKSLWEVLPEAVGTVFEEKYRHAMAHQVSTSFEGYYQPLDLWADIKAYPSEEGLAIYFQDISLRRKLEQQLRESQRLEAVGHLTGGMAHDFNNLLTVIVGNAETLTQELRDQRLQSLAEMITSAALRGAELTQRLLAFARRQALEPVAVDVNQLVSNFDGLLRRTLGAPIDIQWVRAPGLWPAMVDPAQLESALLNLAINARDAMPDGGRLTIETANTRIDDDYARQHAELNPGQYVLVAVSDTGTGIEADDLPQVFDPFFTTKETGKGTGLGLSMVFGFIKQSGGQINIYSEVGEGTTVRMYLPRATGQSELLPPAIQSSASEGGSETILLVEDDDLVRHYASEQLREAGYDVLCAENGPAALVILQSREDIQLLFTDVVMPGGMSGSELAERALLLQPDLKVLYTSGYTENAIVHHGRLDPGLQLLGKPYRRRDLLEKVRKVLAGS